MPNYNDAQGVADLLSQFDFNIISEGPGDFSTQHRKYKSRRKGGTRVICRVGCAWGFHHRPRT